MPRSAHYLDSTGEGPFIRRVFDRDHAARDAAIGLLSAFGFDFVPGNLAGGLALQDAPDAVRVDVCYGIVNPGTSGGTRASIAGMLFEEGFALRDGGLRPAGLGARIRTFDVNGKVRTAASLPGSEHLALIRSYPQLRDVDVYMAAAPSAARGLRIGARATSLAGRVGVIKKAGEAVVSRAVRGSTGGPGPQARAQTSTWVVAEALDAHGDVVATCTLSGADPYDFTAAILAWGADTAVAGGVRRSGALGPIEAFGLAELTAGAAEAGLKQT